jgi:large repetitive protein
MSDQNTFLDLSPRKRATAGNNDESAGGGDVVGGTLDVFRTTDSSVVPPIASSSALNGTAEKAATSTTAVAAITSANQSTDTGSTTADTSSDLSLSLGSTIFTDTGLTTSITSGGLTRDNTLTLSGVVTGVEPITEWRSVVQIYDGATLLGMANFTAESTTDWTFVTPVLLDGSHSFTAKVTDDAGNTTTTSAVTAIVDTTSPDVTSVSSRVRGSQAGKVVQITLNMNEQVTVSAHRSYS